MCITLSAQSTSNFQEDQIEELCYGILNSDYDEEKVQLNKTLKAVLRKSLIQDGAFQYPFDRVQSLGILNSSDSNLRVFNWMVPFEDGSYSYECFLLYQMEDSIAFLELNALNSDSSIVDSIYYTKDNWPAALYYKLITKETEFKTYYTLLGWDGVNNQLNSKIIDVFTFSTKGQLRIGEPIFKTNVQNNKKRILFYYGGQNRMKLSYNETLDWIIYDHLAPASSNLKGVYEYYGADFSYDAYRWEKRYWKYHADVDIDKGLSKKKSDFNSKKEILKDEEPIYKPN